MAGHRRALVIAVDNYDNPSLRRLAAPAADAAALADVLGDPDLGNFDVDIVHNANSSAISERVEDLLVSSGPADLVLLHFSCHGLKDDEGDLYLAASNTVPDRLASTAVDAGWVNRLMQRSRAQRIVLLLDCCYGGAFERGVITRAGQTVDVGDRFGQGQLAEGRGRVVITASTAMEYAFEGTHLSSDGRPGPSAFTGALVQGIRTGEADRDRDGLISLGELYDYIFERVRERSPKQTPSKWEFGMRGGLYIARAVHQIPVGQLPAELVELIDHPSTTVRFGVVDDLRRLSSGTRLPIAAAARAALLRLAHDDSRRVSAAAEAALELTALRLSTASVDFGRHAGDGPRIATVAVHGGPLALGSVVKASRPDLRARIHGSDLTVTWTPQAPGEIDAHVTLSGPAGEAQLRVVGAWLPPPPTPPPIPQAPTTVWTSPPPTVAQGPLRAMPDTHARIQLRHPAIAATPSAHPSRHLGKPVGDRAANLILGIVCLLAVATGLTMVMVTLTAGSSCAPAVRAPDASATSPSQSQTSSAGGAVDSDPGGGQLGGTVGPRPDRTSAAAQQPPATATVATATPVTCTGDGSLTIGGTGALLTAAGLVGGAVALLPAVRGRRRPQ